MVPPSMRLLHLLRSLNPATGGPIEAVRLLSLIHSEWGHEVEIASLDVPGDPVGELPFNLHLLGTGSGTYGGSYLRAGKLIPWLRANRSRFDAVIVNGLWQRARMPRCAAGYRHTVFRFSPRHAGSVVQAALPAQAYEEVALLAVG